MLRVDLDHARRNWLELGPGRIELRHGYASRRSPLAYALQQRLRFAVDGRTLAFGPVAEWLDLPPAARRVEIRLGDEGPPLAVVALDPAPRVEPGWRLSPFEARYLAECGRVHAPAPTPPRPPTTDLHAHFAAAPTAAELIEVGLEVGAVLPPDVLAQLGVSVTAPQPLENLSEAVRRRYAESLAVPDDRRITFEALERIYRRRAPITKHPEALVPLCRRVAVAYAESGVRYAELSLSECVRAAPLTRLHALLPGLEADTGVRLRFLAAVRRDDDYEWDRDYLDRLEAVGRSRAIVGLDFMGHERNSTHAFARQIRELCAWADRARPGFVVRVHAGENPAHPENVRVAAELVRGHAVQLRIGHGLYGVDDRTIAALAEVDAIVEINLDSNLALNNIHGARGVPLAHYLDAGVRVVLGTDGPGLYQTTLPLSARAAALTGLDAAGFETIATAERSYLARRESDDVAVTDPLEAFVVPPDAPPRHFDQARVEAAQRAQREARDAALDARLRALGVPRLDREGLDARVRGRRVLNFAGAWRHAWSKLDDADRAAIRACLEALFDGLAAAEPAGSARDAPVVVTGGTAWGVEAEVQALAGARGIPRVAAIVAETRPEDLDPGGFDAVWVAAESLYDKGEALYRWLLEVDGHCLFFGGGNIVSDEIRIAHNLHLPILLFDGAAGAARDQAEHHPGRAFRSADAALAALRAPPMPTGVGGALWYRGPNPAVDAVVLRDGPSGRELLLRRRARADVEGGRWALPGGFVHSGARRGGPWRPGLETPEAALARVLSDETGLSLGGRDGLSAWRRVTERAGPGRDARDTEQAWVDTTVFARVLAPPEAAAPIVSVDAGAELAWHRLEALPPLAFDHEALLAEALDVLRGDGA